MKKVSKKTVKKLTKKSKVSPKKFKNITVKRYVRKIKVHNKIKAVVVHKHIRRLRIRNVKQIKTAKPSKIIKLIPKQAKPKVITRAVKQKPKIIVKQVKPKAITKVIVKEKPKKEVKVIKKVVVVKQEAALTQKVITKPAEDTGIFKTGDKIFISLILGLYALCLIGLSIYSITSVDAIKVYNLMWMPIICSIVGIVLLTSPYFLIKGDSPRSISKLFVSIYIIAGLVLIGLGVYQIGWCRDIFGGVYISIPILNLIFGPFLLLSPILLVKKKNKSNKAN